MTSLQEWPWTWCYNSTASIGLVKRDLFTRFCMVIRDLFSNLTLKSYTYNWVCWKHQNFHECAARMKSSMFSTHKMKYIWYLLKKSKFSFYFILFLEDLQFIILLTMLQGESQWCKRRQRSICDRIPGSIYMIYSHQDLQMKRNLFSVKVRDKWRHKRRHTLLMTLHSICYMHCLTHWSRRCWKFKIEKFQQIWINLVSKCSSCSN